MDTPPLKKSRRGICPCPACGKQERDIRTVERHMSIYFSSNDPSMVVSDSDSTLAQSSNHESVFSTQSSTLSEDEHNMDLDQPYDSTNNENVDHDVNVDGSSYNDYSNTDQNVLDYLYNEVLVKLTYGSSQSEFEKHLANTSSLLSEHVFGSKLPRTWRHMLKILKENGYNPPKHYKVCTARNHSILLQSPSMHPNCPKCGTPWSNCIDYYVLGLGFDGWFVTGSKCERLMAHWDDKETWFQKGTGDGPGKMSELWHGKRFREINSFWDPSEVFLLPHRCDSCNSIISQSEIEKHIVASDTFCTLPCPSCHQTNTFSLNYAKGDPRNQAVIIHEDGWNSHSTSSKHGMAAITVTHACMTKKNRSDSQNALVYSFIPVDQLPHDSPHKMDGFLQPLIEELEELYIEGQEVFFHSEVNGISPPKDITTLRVIPLLVTADSKAHAEIGLTTAGGRKGCRRCKMIGTYVEANRHYYYGDMQYRHRFPADRRTAVENRAFGKLVDNAPNPTQRKRLTTQHGVTGESIFYRLFDLCGFDPIYDLVIDVMHAIALNLVKTELQKQLVGKDILTKEKLAKALKCVKWTTELKDGRVPSVCISSSSDKKSLGHWKSEDYSKFTLVAPYVLHSIIPKENYECFMLLCRIHKLVYSMQIRVQGWEEGDIALLKNLLWAHAIMYEKLYGLTACSENTEYCLHIPDDIIRHSAPDNYWCYLYERQVSFYKQQSSNQRQLCKTFSDRAAQLRFLNDYFANKPVTIVHENDDLTSKFPEPILLVQNTVDLAYQLKDKLDSTVLTPAMKNQYQNGIAIGSLNFFKISPRVQRDIKLWFTRENASPASDMDLPQFGYSFNKVLKVNNDHYGTVYRVGDYVIIEDANDTSLEWVVQIDNLFVCGPVNNCYQLFFGGSYYPAKTCGTPVDIDPWTNQPKLVPRNYEVLRCQPLKYIKKKIMLYPQPGHEHSPSYYLSIDQSTVDFSEVNVPYYPKCGEVVVCKSGKTVLIDEVNDELRNASCFTLKWLRATIRWQINQHKVGVDLIDVIKPVDNITKRGQYIYYVTT